MGTAASVFPLISVLCSFFLPLHVDVSLCALIRSKVKVLLVGSKCLCAVSRRTSVLQCAAAGQLVSFVTVAEYLCQVVLLLPLRGCSMWGKRRRRRRRLRPAGPSQPFAPSPGGWRSQRGSGERRSRPSRPR